MNLYVQPLENIITIFSESITRNSSEPVTEVHHLGFTLELV